MLVSNSTTPLLFQFGSQDRNATYSKEAQEFAEEALDLFESSPESLGPASELAQEVFREIKESRASTDAEKTLASLGLSLSKVKTKNSDYVALAQRSVLSSIASAVPGPLGQVLAQSGIEAMLASEKSPTVAAQVGEFALEAIIESPETTYQEQSLAAFGIEFTQGAPARKSSHTRLQFLKALADGVNGADSESLSAERDLQSSAKLAAHLTKQLNRASRSL